MTFDREEFEQARKANSERASTDPELQNLACSLILHSNTYDHAYQWTWCGLPIIQLTEDMIATQELIWTVRPDIFIEIGIAWGGSIAFYASIMELLGKGEVIGVDPVLPESNREAISSFGFSKRITLIQGSSLDARVIKQIKDKTSHKIGQGQTVMVRLDGNHTQEIVLKELEIYSSMVQKGSYLIVSNTIIEQMEPLKHRPRPWGKGNNPYSALREFLKTNQRFEIDSYISAKLLISYDRYGYLKCVR